MESVYPLPKSKGSHNSQSLWVWSYLPASITPRVVNIKFDLLVVVEFNHGIEIILSCHGIGTHHIVSMGHEACLGCRRVWMDLLQTKPHPLNENY